MDGVFEILKIQNTSGDAKFTGTALEVTGHTVSGDLDVAIENTSLKKIQADVERDYFMSAEEAKEYHIIDEIYQPRDKQKK